MNFNRLIKLCAVRVQTFHLDYRSVTKTIITADGKEVPKEKNRESRITLISPDNSVSITNLKSAQSISLRRDLKLVKVVDVDTKTKRPVYKLMTSSEYHQEELEQRKSRQEARKNSFIKGEKLLNLSSRIGDHDLMTGVKKMIKLLEKRYEVRVVISGSPDDTEKTESMASVIESNIKSIGRLVQKRSKGNAMKFQLIPLKDKTSNSQSTDGSPSDDSPKDDKGPL